MTNRDSLPPPSVSPGSCALLAGLLKTGALTATNVAMLHSFMQTWQLSAYHAILATSLLSEAELANALARALGLPRLFLVQTLSLADEAVAVLGFRRARQWQCVPLRSVSGGIELACADPTRSDRFDKIKRGLNREITLAVAELSDIVKAIDELYPLAAQLPSLYGQQRSAKTP